MPGVQGDGPDGGAGGDPDREAVPVAGRRGRVRHAGGERRGLDGAAVPEIGQRLAGDELAGQRVLAGCVHDGDARRVQFGDPPGPLQRLGFGFPGHGDPRPGVDAAGERLRPGLRFVLDPPGRLHLPVEAERCGLAVLHRDVVGLVADPVDQVAHLPGHILAAAHISGDHPFGGELQPVCPLNPRAGAGVVLVGHPGGGQHRDVHGGPVGAGDQDGPAERAGAPPERGRQVRQVSRAGERGCCGWQCAGSGQRCQPCPWRTRARPWRRGPVRRCRLPAASMASCCPVPQPRA